jgi:hypothetical protein
LHGNASAILPPASFCAIASVATGRLEANNKHRLKSPPPLRSALPWRVMVRVSLSQLPVSSGAAAEASTNSEQQRWCSFSPLVALPTDDDRWHSALEP